MAALGGWVALGGGARAEPVSSRSPSPVLQVAHVDTIQTEVTYCRWASGSMVPVTSAQSLLPINQPNIHTGHQVWNAAANAPANSK